MGELHGEVYEGICLTHGEYLKILSKPLNARLNHSIHAEISLMKNVPILFHDDLDKGMRAIPSETSVLERRIESGGGY